MYYWGLSEEGEGGREGGREGGAYCTMVTLSGQPIPFAGTRICEWVVTLRECTRIRERWNLCFTMQERDRGMQMCMYCMANVTV